METLNYTDKNVTINNGKKTGTWRSRNRKTMTGIVFTAPALLVILVFFIYPAFMSFRFSVTDWNGFSLNYNFVGLDNFYYVIKSPEFTQLIKNTLFLIVLYVPVLNIISLLFAVLLYDIGKMANFYKVVLYLPNILSMVVVGVIWRVIYNPVFGPLQYILNKVGLGHLVQDWLGQVSTVMPALSISIIWYAVGFYMMIYLGGLSTIPAEMYESASIDGVTKTERLFYITLPMLAPSITINVVISTIGILTIFDLPFVLTGGGPGFASQTMAIDVYIFAFKSMQQGAAMALAIILTIVTLIFVVLQLMYLRRKEMANS